MIPVICVARGRNGEISRNGKIPWRNVDDLAHMRNMAARYGECLFGWNTFREMGFRSPHEYSHSIVMTSVDMTGQPGYTRGSGSFTYLNGFQQIPAEVEHWWYDTSLLILGGTEIYRHFMPYANTYFITEIDYEAPEGTEEEHTYFPNFDETLFNKRVETTLADGTIVYRYDRIDYIDPLAEGYPFRGDDGRYDEDEYEDDWDD